MEAQYCVAFKEIFHDCAEWTVVVEGEIKGCFVVKHSLYSVIRES
jgi:hypothetical protein